MGNDKPISRRPIGPLRGGCLMKAILRCPRFLYRKVFKRDLYNVGVIRAPIHSLLNPKWKHEIHWLPERPRPGIFIADPFGIELAGKQYLLCEYFDYREGKGRILGAEIKDATVVGGLKDAITAPFHLSYPFLFTYEGDVFCVPETSRASEVTLFKADVLPCKWRKEAVLLNNVPAIDPSIVHFNGRWWLFYGDLRTGSASLYVSYADSLLGPWLPHARQPVKTDIASSRPGGTPFVHNGKLYRPAQDCSRIYGGRVVINEIVALSPGDFEEKTVAAVEPDRHGPYPNGLHTLSALGDITLVDGKREKFIFSAVVGSTKKFLRTITKTTKPGEL